jgi:hypothetical protein
MSSNLGIMTAELLVPLIDMWALLVLSAEFIDDLRAGFPAEQLQSPPASPSA